MLPIPHVKLAFDSLADKLRSGETQVTVSRDVLANLCDLYISCWDFDEEWYLATYPDIKEAITQGHFPSGWSHFRTVGYLEGRLGTQPSVDAEWYLNTYPDIA